jgi:hypothetical protein
MNLHETRDAPPPTQQAALSRLLDIEKTVLLSLKLLRFGALIVVFRGD